MKNKLIGYFSFLVLFIIVTPSFSLADFTLGVNTTSTFQTTIEYVRELVDLALPLVATLALLAFFWGLAKFILNSNKPEEIKNGRNYMVWGILILFVLLTYKVIVGLIAGDLPYGTNNTDQNTLLLPHD